MQDFATRKQRLSKKPEELTDKDRLSLSAIKDLESHFILADNDDFFGFTEEKDMPYWKQVLIAIGMVVVLYLVLVIWFSISN